MIAEICEALNLPYDSALGEILAKIEGLKAMPIRKIRVGYNCGRNKKGKGISPIRYKYPEVVKLFRSQKEAEAWLFKRKQS